MAAAKNQPDAQKVFRAIAMILNQREDAAKVELVGVREKEAENARKAS